MEPMKLNASEWNVLNCLWENHPRTVMQLVPRWRRWNMQTWTAMGIRS